MSLASSIGTFLADAVPADASAQVNALGRAIGRAPRPAQATTPGNPAMTVTLSDLATAMHARVASRQVNRWGAAERNWGTADAPVVGIAAASTTGNAGSPQSPLTAGPTVFGTGPHREVALGDALQDPLFGLGGSLLPDNAGQIRHVALQFGNVEFDRPLPESTSKAMLGMYRTLVQSMSPDTRFTIVTANGDGEAALKRMIAESGIQHPERVQVINLEAKRGISIWIRDSMIPVRDADGSWKLLIQDRTYWPGPEDNRVPAIIGQQAEGMRALAHPALRIDGGNMISTRDFAFIGVDSFQHTTDRLRELARDPGHRAEIIRFYEQRTGKRVLETGQPGPGEVGMDTMWQNVAREVFKSEFHRQVFSVGDDDPSTPMRETQPAFHIDMGMTPIGEGTFLVGDPSMALRVLKGLSPEEKQRVNRQMATEAGLDPGKDLVEDLIQVNTDDAQQANFENVARQLKGAGYNVVRVPFLTGVRTTWRLPYLTYNNSLQEVYRDAAGQQVRKIYLPVYGCEPLDRMATDAYQSLGYQVVPLHMAAVSKLEGAIRCSAYPVQRTEVPLGSASSHRSFVATV